jgi:citrate lyase beta subunit
MQTTLRVRRSLLFVPGAEPRKIERAREAGADTLVFDLEDSVTPDRKAEARELIASLFREGEPAQSELAVRVNAPSSDYFAPDVDAVVAAGARTLMLPKCESETGLRQAVQRIEASARSLAGDNAEPLRVLALVESAAGIAHAASLPGSSARIEALCFGHADFSLDMGLAEPDASQGVVWHARCALAIAARATNTSPIDCVCLAVKDPESFRRDTREGQQLGYEGKLCIHPAQVEVANQLYTPTSGEIETAQRIVQGWERARSQGLGVFTIDEKMVDAPLVTVQERVLERARLAGVLGEKRADP